MFNNYKIIQKTFLMSLILVLSMTHQTRADSEAIEIIGKIVAGAVLLGINETKPSDDNVDEEIIWNDEVEQERDSASAQSRYDQRTYDIQKHLNQLGFNSGTADGLSGAKTLDAIRRWEAEYEQESDGKISEDEYQHLKSLALSGANSEGSKISSNSNDQHDELVGSYESLIEFQSIHKVCLEFIDTGHPYSYSIDTGIEKKSNAHIGRFQAYIAREEQCLGVNQKQSQAIQASAKRNHERTDDYRMYKIVVPMAMSDNRVAMDVVKACDAYVSAMLILKKKSDEYNADQTKCDLK